MFTTAFVFAAIFAAVLNVLCTGYIVTRALVYHMFEI